MVKLRDNKVGYERGVSEPEARLPHRPSSNSTSGRPKKQRSFESGLKDLVLEDTSAANNTPKLTPSKQVAPPAKGALSKKQKKDPEPKEKGEKKRTGSDASLSSRHTSSSSGSPSDGEHATSRRANLPKKGKKKKKKSKTEEKEKKAVVWSEEPPVGKEAGHPIRDWEKSQLWQGAPQPSDMPAIRTSCAKQAKDEEFSKALAYRKMEPHERYREDIKDIRQYAAEVSNRMVNGLGTVNPPVAQDYIDTINTGGGRDPSAQIRLGTQVRATSLRLRHLDRPIDEILGDVDALEKILAKKPKEYFKSADYQNRNKVLRETRVMLQRQVQAVQGDEYWDKVEGHARQGVRGWTPSLVLMDDEEDE